MQVLIDALFAFCAALGALVYSVLSYFILKFLGLEVPLTRAMAQMLSGSVG
jgi:predicted membrane-bound spermidine synthase